MPRNTVKGKGSKPSSRRQVEKLEASQSLLQLGKEKRVGGKPVKKLGAAGGNIKRAIRSGRILRTTVASHRGRSYLAIELERAEGSVRLIYLFPPVIESQFIYQMGKVVSLPVEKIEGQWCLRRDKQAMRQMKRAGVYDPKLLPNMFGPKRWR